MVALLSKDMVNTRDVPQWAKDRDSGGASPTNSAIGNPFSDRQLMRKTLDAPDFKHRTDVNEGFVDIGSAATAIGLVMPDGAEPLLKRAIDSDVSDYDLEKIISALADGAGKRNRSLFHRLLTKARTREHAAVAIEKISLGSNNGDDIAALSAALANEERENVTGAILMSLASIGPDANELVSEALNRAPPWTRMDLTWQLKGLTARPG